MNSLYTLPSVQLTCTMQVLIVQCLFVNISYYVFPQNVIVFIK
jgi:hypothetical protein